MPAYRSIAVLTGAGVSAESGLPTFRDADGLWEQHRIEDVASPEAFARDSELVHRFSNQRRRQLLDPRVRPNAAHLALAELERRFHGAFLLVTQNIDNLHERAGSQRVIHMHGELLKARCLRRDTVFPIEGDLSPADRCGCCTPPSVVRPHVVWFGETPLDLEAIGLALSRCDVFVAIGTSGHVYPAAGFVQEARAAGAHTVELNLEPSAASSAFVERIYGTAGQIVPAFVTRLLSDYRAGDDSIVTRPGSPS